MKRILFVVLLAALIMPNVSYSSEKTHRKVAEELLEVANGRQIHDQMHSYMASMMEQQFNSMGLPPEGREAAAMVQKEIMDWFSEVFAWEQVRDMYVDTYVEVFTEKELKELVDFYKSPLGQKMLAKMPELLETSMRKSQEMLQNHMPEFQKKLEKSIDELMEKYKEE